MIVGIHQPNFLPWIGYFKKISNSNVFVFLDDVEFSNRSYTKRTKILVGKEVKWLGIPCKDKRKIISEVRIDNSNNWKKNHLKTFKHFYRNAKYYNEIYDLLNFIYENNYTYLMDFNLDLIYMINDYLNINTKIKMSSDLDVCSKKNQRILDICKVLGATEYISGIGAKDYNIDSDFLKNKIKINYNIIKEIHYNQTGKKFIFGLSIIDLLFNEGKNSINILNES
jgi:hypothetical protein